MTPTSSGIAQWVDVVAAEYRELPGLSLNKAQMRRLWSLEPHVCDALVEALVARGILRRAAGDCYLKSTTTA